MRMAPDFLRNNFGNIPQRLRYYKEPLTYITYYAILTKSFCAAYFKKPDYLGFCLYDAAFE